MKEKIILYISNPANPDPRTGMRFETENFENVEELNNHLRQPFGSMPYGNELYIDHRKKGPITLEEYHKEVLEERLKDQDVFWDFVKKVKEETSQSGDKDAMKNVFETYPEEKKGMLKRIYDAVSDKLEKSIWDKQTELYSHPGYLTEDGMLELIPHLISLGKKEVESFYEHPEKALDIYYAGEWEYSFDLTNVFLYYKPMEA